MIRVPNLPSRKLAFSGLLLLVLTLAGCASQGKQKDLQDTLRQYESMVRWSQWDGALQFISPEWTQAHPITPLDIDRLRQFRVTNYTVRSSLPYDDGNGLRQTVEIRMFNRNQATERAIMDNQDWRWEEEAGVWLLHTGLPDVTRGR